MRDEGIISGRIRAKVKTDKLPMPMDDNEIQQLRKEIARLQGLLEARQAPTPVRSDTTSLIDNSELIQDCARYAEGVLEQQQVKKKWREVVDERTWNELGSDDAFCDAIEAEKLRRVRSGQAKTEKAQLLVVKTPEILDSIASDKSASPRHRVDAIKTLDGMSDTGPQATPAADRFVIRIDLGADYKLVVDQPIRPTPGNNEIIDSTVLPMIEKDGGNGEPI